MLSAETASGSQRIFSTAALGCGTDPGHLQQIWQVHGRVELQASPSHRPILGSEDRRNHARGNRWRSDSANPRAWLCCRLDLVHFDFCGESACAAACPPVPSGLVLDGDCCDQHRRHHYVRSDQPRPWLRHRHGRRPGLWGRGTSADHWTRHRLCDLEVDPGNFRRRQHHHLAR
ncbi:Uncharacterised protein [Mycobacteroides abscessus subsp. massiliense]|nr:Uncharacterised protein [Mycobacteroides abscessus subsp. massiliense]